MAVKGKLCLVLMLFFNSISLYGQDTTSVVNLIISIDDNVVIGMIAQPKLLLYKEGNSTRTVEASYIPGKLCFDSKDKKDILSSDSAYIAFNFYESRGEKQIIHNYEIALTKAWLDYSFIVLKLYKNNKGK